MFPSHARMYIAPICDDETWAERVDFWYNVYVLFPCDCLSTSDIPIDMALI